MNNRPLKLPEVPPEFTEAILRSSRKIRRRRQLQYLTAAAAGLVVVFAGLSLMKPAEDMVLTDTPSQTVLREVWAHPEDAFYHGDIECGACLDGAVILEKQTALEFGKEPCEQCAS